MAASPRWKVFDTSSGYIASCKFIEDAALLVSAKGNGATIRDGHERGRPVIWTEGRDGIAANSYDYVADVVLRRVTLIRAPRAAGVES